MLKYFIKFYDDHRFKYDKQLTYQKEKKLNKIKMDFISMFLNFSEFFEIL